MQRTPWTKPKGSSSLPSDRIKPLVKSPNTVSKSKGNGRQQPWPPKSKQVKDLETLIQAIRNATSGDEKDPKGGCFCLGTFSFFSPIDNILNFFAT